MLSLQKKRNKQRKGYILKYTLPGLENEIEIPFPDKKLPVCARCKKIYKTRELCRVRDGHTDVAWNTTHLCFRLDDSCFAENEKGDICLVDESTMKFVASHTTGPAMPYQTKKSDMLLSKTPICMACKQKNYTTNHCREKQKHRQLPWSTVYFTLSAIPLLKHETTNEDTTNIPITGNKRKSVREPVSSSTNSLSGDNSMSKRRRVDVHLDRSTKDETGSIWDVAPSRTFLLTITGKSSTLQVSLLRIFIAT